MPVTTRRIVLKVALRLTITALFVTAILVELRHPHEWATLFVAWAYPSWGAVVVSCAEIIALAMLWIDRFALAATGLLAITLTGAIGTWLIHGPRATAAYPGAILLMVAVLAWTEHANKG